MAFRIRDGALITEDGSEGVGDGEEGDRLLRGPPGVFAAVAVVMIAVPDPIQTRGVDGVAPHVEETAVAAAVGGELGVAVEFAAPDVELLAVEGGAEIADGGDGIALGLGIGSRGDGLGGFDGFEYGGGCVAAAVEVGCVEG